MTKEELLEMFEQDFKKTKTAITEIISHNRAIDSTLVDDLVTGDHAKLEEHIEVSKLIMEGVKSFNELYKNAPAILENINKMVENSKDSKKEKPSLKEIMDNLD